MRTHTHTHTQTIRVTYPTRRLLSLTWEKPCNWLRYSPNEFRHAILPVVALSITGISSIALHTREKLIEVMESDYVLFARARGESDWSILRRHGLRNILLPAMTLQFASVSEIIGGSVLVEQVFSYPGLGQAAVTAGLGSDVPLLLGITVVTAVIVAAGNLAANVLYGVIDPRIREGAKR